MKPAAYGKSLRTVKSCVGSTWCRYGVQDSTGLAVRLEHRIRNYAPRTKYPVAVRLHPRCEAQGKISRVIALGESWNHQPRVCGSGGMKPRHADLFATISTKRR
ncbi:hypothetical protein MJ561_17900 [Klebsiella pneumoniae]|nr:hypothetical protein MJ561_17900 [Klebsiella pneumoniae]